MPSSVRASSRSKSLWFPAFAAIFFFALAFIPSRILVRETKAQGVRGPMEPSPPPADTQAPPAQPPEAQTAQPAATASQPDEGASTPKAPYDPALFQPKMTPDQLAFLKRIGHVASGTIWQDGDFHKLAKAVIPDCEFHYGRDMPLMSALDLILKTSTERAQITDKRYLLISGDTGPYLQGRAFMWFDMQDGIALRGFYFHPTNGEPTPTMAVFSRQVKEKYLEMSQLPTEFAEQVNEWSGDTGVPPVLTRYFLTGNNKRVLLAHDEDYCSAADSVGDSSGRDCEEMNADAADIDMNAAYYLEQTHNATNATEWMALGEDQVSWIQVRESTCGAVADPLACRIRMAHERTRVILTGSPEPHRPTAPAPHK